MPRVIDSTARTDELVEIMCDLVCQHGAAELTVRTLARRIGMSAAGLMNHYTSKHRLLMIFTSVVANRRQEAISRRAYRGGLTTFLPATEDELRDEIAWRSMCELGREDETLAEYCAVLHDAARHLWHDISMRDLDRTELDLLTAVMDGLSVALTQPARPLSPARAQAALDLATKILLAPAPPRTRAFPDFENAQASGWFAA